MNKNKRAASLVLAGLLTFSLSGCSGPKELGTDRTGIDILKSEGEEKDTNDLESGVTQELEVPGETFKLLVNYSVLQDTIWRVTDTKNLNMKILTKGLPKGVEVYIDNIHADTTIVSDKNRYDGILQDTMDDRIHNSLMLGFPISDTVSYYGTNIIEGQNKEFLTMWSYGFQGYSNGVVNAQRYLESDFLANSVWANKIDSVIDLIIVDTNTNIVKTVSVYSTLLVEVNKRVTFIEQRDKEFFYVVYEYNRDGSKKEVSVELIPEEDNTLKLKPER